MDATKQRRQIRTQPEITEAIKNKRYGRKIREAATLYALLGARLLDTQEGKGQLRAMLEDEGVPNKRGMGRQRIGEQESVILEVLMLPALSEALERSRRDLSVKNDAAILRALIRAGLESGESIAAVSDALFV